MDLIKGLMETQLTEGEIIIFQLVKSGMDYRDLGRRLGVHHSYIGRTYDRANKKLDKMGQIFQSPVDKTE